MTFAEWLAFGIENGWASQGVCQTHEGVPMTEEEEAAWDEGNDPCIPVVRIFLDNISE